MTTYVKFVTRSGTSVEGTVHEDYGHAFAIQVVKTNRKNLRNRLQLFPKHDMNGLVTEVCS